MAGVAPRCGRAQNSSRARGSRAQGDCTYRRGRTDRLRPWRVVRLLGAEDLDAFCELVAVEVAWRSVLHDGRAAN